MGFQSVGSSKGCQVGARHARNVCAPKKRHASIKTYQVALIRESHRPVMGQVIVCARSLRNGPSKVHWDQWVQPSSFALFKQSTGLLGLGRKKRTGRRLYIERGSRTNGSAGIISPGHQFLLHLDHSSSGGRLSSIRRNLSCGVP